jgi:hypothetical protein
MSRYQFAMLAVIAAATTAVAAMPGFAYTQEAQQMCSGDAMRLCSAEIPDIPRITACMARNKHRVSPGCRAVMDKEAAAAASARKRAAAVD